MIHASGRPALAAAAAVAALALALSCATPPKAVESPAPAAPQPAQAEPAPAAPQAEPAAPAPDELRSKAANLKKRAFDLGLKELMPKDYSSADAALSSGNAAYGKDNAAAAAGFELAASKFEALIAAGLPVLAERERKRAEDLRDTAVGKGAEASFPELFAYAESELAKPSASEASGEYESASRGYAASSKEYEVLYKLCDAKTAREAIAARDFAKWDPSNWSLAETRFKASQDLLRSDAPAAATSVDEAILRYGIAGRTALEYYASDRKKSSEDERSRAEGIKSEVAVKDEFAAAQTLYAEAESAHAAKDFDGSSSLYDKAASAFALAYDHAKVKMDGATTEIDSLDEALAASGVR